MDKKEIVKFFFELGQLKRVQHVGWTVAGVRNPESVAEHAFRTAQIGYVLADLEGANPEKVALMCLIHDNGEARINDTHRVANRYLGYYKVGKAETKAFKEQTERLPGSSKKQFRSIIDEFEQRKTKEAQVAKDADYIDQAVTAKEYIDIGYKACQDWINNIRKALKTKTAKQILDIIEKTDRNSWWQGLKELKEVLEK